MLILIGGEKGGTGKSCLTQNIAVLLQKTESSILIIDCDPQKTTSDWAQERCNNTKKPHIECIQMYGNILHNLESLKLKYKIILVDCGGQDSKALRSSLVSCTHALFPIRPKRRDLKTISHLEELIEAGAAQISLNYGIDDEGKGVSQSYRSYRAIQNNADVNIYFKKG